MKKSTSGWRPSLENDAAYKLPKENVLHSDYVCICRFSIWLYFYIRKKLRSLLCTLYLQLQQERLIQVLCQGPRLRPQGPVFPDLQVRSHPFRFSAEQNDLFTWKFSKTTVLFSSLF